MNQFLVKKIKHHALQSSESSTYTVFGKKNGKKTVIGPDPDRTSITKLLSKQHVDLLPQSEISFYRRGHDIISREFQ